MHLPEITPTELAALLSANSPLTVSRLGDLAGRITWDIAHEAALAINAVLAILPDYAHTVRQRMQYRAALRDLVALQQLIAYLPKDDHGRPLPRVLVTDHSGTPFLSTDRRK